MKILLAVDGSKNSTSAVRYVVEHANLLAEKPGIELLTVHLPVPKLPRMGMVVGKSQIERYYADEGEQALAAAKRKLDAAGIKYQARILVGQIAETIAAHALRYGCDLICIGTHGRGPVGSVVLGSVAARLAQIARVPVMLVR